MSFTLYLLSKYPRIEAELVQEHRDVLGERAPALNDMPSLRQTQMALSEVLRLYPPSWQTIRRPVEDVVLGGFRILAGTDVFLTQWLLHRDPAYYPEPDRFDPSRWTDPKATDRLEREGKYTPFWFGRKKCIGYQFARMEAVLVLSTLLRSFQVEVLQKDIQLNAGPFLHPTALRVRLRRRHRPQPAETRPAAVGSIGNGHGA
jgi:cytochrome P450